MSRKDIIEDHAPRETSPDRLIRALQAAQESPEPFNSTELLRELADRQLELEMQNQELNEAWAELASNMRQLENLYDSSPVGYFSIEERGIIRQLNFTAANMLGMKRRDIMGRCFSEFTAPENRLDFKRFLSRIFAGEPNEPCEVTLVSRTGPALIASITGTLSPKGMVCHVAAVDLTAQRAMEAAAREKQEDLERIFNLSHDLMCIAGTNGFFHRVNPAFSRVLGYEKNVITDSGFLNLVHPDDVEHTRAMVSLLGCGSEVLDFVNRCRCADGSYRWLEWRAVPYGDGMICALARDISERKLVEDALRESEGRLSLFILHAPAAIAMFDREMRYVAASERWMRDYGLAGDLRGRSHYEIFPEISEVWKEVHRRGLAGETLSADEDKFQRADGSVQWLKWDVRPWFLANGEVGGILIGSEDITGRRKVREALEKEVRRRTAQLQTRTLQLRALADELTHAEERERGRIAGLIHEDLQQMLVAALLNLGFLKSKRSDPTNEEDFTRIEEILRGSIKTARSLSTELSPPVLQQCGLCAALKWLGDLCLEKYGLNVAVVIEQGLEPGIDTAAILFRSVRELLLNITKHAGVPSATLRMWSEGDSELKILISDEGAGFDPEEVRAREGMAGGFGLFSIRERMEWLGGGFEIESVPGAGSRLTLWVPLKPAPERPSVDGDYGVSRPPALAK